jgi:hypothetical protein
VHATAAAATTGSRSRELLDVVVEFLVAEERGPGVGLAAAGKTVEIDADVRVEEWWRRRRRRRAAPVIGEGAAAV